jgi:hypothetical protein
MGYHQIIFNVDVKIKQESGYPPKSTKVQNFS